MFNGNPNSAEPRMSDDGQSAVDQKTSQAQLPYSDTRKDCQITSSHTRPCYAKLSSRLDDSQILHGSIQQVDHVPSGPTNSAAITTKHPLRLCGGKLLVAVTRERRYGLRRPHVNDDDNHCCYHALTISTHRLQENTYYLSF